MDIFPSLGLAGGRWVASRAQPGEANKPYPDGPVVKAGELEKLGARWLHLVDVDGARGGRPRQLGLMRSVMQRVGCKVQIGGGFRTELFIDEALRSGAARVVLGTRAIGEPMWLDTVLGHYGHERILVSVDCIRGIVSVEGWETQTMHTASSTGERLAKQGVERIVYTDLGADMPGQDGPDLAGVQELAERSGLRLIVSGGVRRLEHIEQLSARLGDRLEGVIVDRGFVDGTLDLAKAFARYPG
jgi:phosphoribosylformimino-5-aminoimidazole carboxamide ribotide isomerase